MRSCLIFLVTSANALSPPPLIQHYPPDHLHPTALTHYCHHHPPPKLLIRSKQQVAARRSIHPIHKDPLSQHAGLLNFTPSANTKTTKVILAPHSNQPNFQEIDHLFPKAYLADENEILRIKYLAKVASFAYKFKKGMVRDRQLLDNFDVISIIEEGQHLAYIAIDPLTQNLIISFRGTSALWTWVDNFHVDMLEWPSTIPTSVKGIKVHKGFYRIWTSLQAKVIQVMRTPKVQAYLHHKYQQQHITPCIQITGHSMGGAVASIAALYLVSLGLLEPNMIELTTFGSPMVGNVQFALAMNQFGFMSLSRVINGDDNVPQLPGEILGYKHYQGERVILNRGQKMMVNTDETVSLTKANLIPSVKAHLGLFNETNFF